VVNKTVGKKGRGLIMMKTMKSLGVMMFILWTILGCKPGKQQQQVQPPPPPVPKSFQIAFQNEQPYGLDFEQGFATEGMALAYEDTKAGLESDMLSGYFIKAKTGKAAVLYLRHEEASGGVGMHVLSLQLSKLAPGTDSIPKEKFKGVLYIYYNTPKGDFFQARRGQGVVALEAVTKDSVKGTLDLALVGKLAEGRVKESQPKELTLMLKGRFGLPLKTPKEVVQIQTIREFLGEP
jgi:hypothetical protein